MRRDRSRAILVLVFGACVIGLAPVLVRFADAGPAAAGFWRLVFALPFLGVLAARTSGAIGAPSRLAVLAGLFFALDLGFWHYGIAYTSVGKATVLANLTPVAVTAIAWIVFNQRPGNLFLLAVVLAVAGVWTMTLAKGSGSVGTNPPLGDALSITTALWYALYFLSVSAARRRESASAIMLWSSLVGTPLLFVFALLLGESLLPASPAGWAACAGLGLVHVAGQGSIAWALGRLPPATASVTVLVQPVVASVLGWALFNEVLGSGQMAGAFVALTGVVLAQYASGATPSDTDGVRASDK
jgi:drug/metabolite transporter (DMT)-like permease